MRFRILRRYSGRGVSTPLEFGGTNERLPPLREHDSAFAFVLRRHSAASRGAKPAPAGMLCAANPIPGSLSFSAITLSRASGRSVAARSMRMRGPVSGAYSLHRSAGACRPPLDGPTAVRRDRACPFERAPTSHPRRADLRSHAVGGGQALPDHPTVHRSILSPYDK